MALFPELQQYVESIQNLTNDLESKRKIILNQIVDYVRTAEHPRLNFICTHNSRRSHLSQIWAQTAAHMYQIPVETYSGGTEATAFHPNAIAAIHRAGFQVETGVGQNPMVQVNFTDELLSMECFSKKYNDSPNPSKGFAAIMTCSEADADCPLVLGADARIKLFYQDPKEADGTAFVSQAYDERCKQIAVEMCYIFSQING